MLKLDELFKLFEEVENSTLLEKPEGSVRTQTGEQKTIKIPRLFISEDWGKKGNVDRQDLEIALQSAGVALGGDPITAIKQLQEGLNKSIADLKGGITSENPAVILSKLVVFDTINRLYNSFQSSPLGFVNEAFMSVLYGGQQIKTSEGNKESNIGDVKDKDGTPVSIKTIAPATPIKGSVENLRQSLAKYGKVYFDIFIKQMSGDEIVNFELLRFEVNRENVEKLIPGIGKIPDSSQVSGQTEQNETIVLNEVAVSNDEELKKFIEDVREAIKTKDLKGFKEKTNYQSPSSLTINRGVMEVLFNNKPEVWSKDGNPRHYRLNPPDRLEALTDYAIIKGLMEPGEKESIINFLRDIDVLLGPGERTGDIKDRQFEFKLDAATRLAGERRVNLNFSRKNIDELLELSVTKLQTSVFRLFSQVETFSENLNKYFMSVDPNRASQYAQPAIESANAIKQETEATIKNP